MSYTDIICYDEVKKIWRDCLERKIRLLSINRAEIRQKFTGKHLVVTSSDDEIYRAGAVKLRCGPGENVDEFWEKDVLCHRKVRPLPHQWSVCLSWRTGIPLHDSQRSGGLRKECAAMNHDTNVGKVRLNCFSQSKEPGATTTSISEHARPLILRWLNMKISRQSMPAWSGISKRWTELSAGPAWIRWPMSRSRGSQRQAIRPSEPGRSNRSFFRAITISRSMITDEVLPDDPGRKNRTPDSESRKDVS